MNGRRYYGRDPSQQLMQFYEQNPFYNPFSPYPDIGAGLSGMLQMALTNRQLMKEQEEARKQQEFENQLALRQMEMQERRFQEPTERQVPEWQAKWQLAAQKAQTGEWTPEQAENYILGVKPTEKKKWPKASISQITKIFPEYTEEDISSMDDAQIQDLLNEVQVRGRKPEVGGEQFASDNRLIDSAIQRYGNEINKVTREYQAGKKGSADELSRLGNVLDHLYSLKTSIPEAGLSESQRKRVKSIFSSLERAKKEGMGMFAAEIEGPTTPMAMPTPPSPVPTGPKYLETRRARDGKLYGRIGPDQWILIKE